MDDENKKKILPPYMVSDKGKSIVDWDALTRMYLDQTLTAKDFLEQFRGIDITKRKTLEFLKRWEVEKNKQWTKNYTIRRNVKKLSENELIDQDTILRRIEFLKTRQAVEDHEAAECVKHALLEKVNRGNVSTNELAVIIKSLEVVQKIQRIAIGLPPNGSSDDKPKNLTEEQKTNNLNDNQDIPTFIVEMNKNGKFKRLKPRKKT